MGLDQYLTHLQPNVLDPYDKGPELAYWRKDWALQNFINSDNCETIHVTTEFCDDILSNLHIIYEDADDDTYSDNTYNAFVKAKSLLEQGERVIYEADW